MGQGGVFDESLRPEGRVACRRLEGSGHGALCIYCGGFRRKRMRRFYVQPEYIKGNKIIITQGQVHHLRDVLRLKKGNPVVVFDGKGNEYHGLIAMIKPTEVIVDVKSSRFMLAKD